MPGPTRSKGKSADAAMGGPARRAGAASWHPHELRHSCASLLLAQGTRLEVVSEMYSVISGRLRSR